MAKEKSAKFSVIGLGLGAGVTWGLYLLITGWTAIFGWGNLFVRTLESVYIGYEPSFIGGVIGGIWGFCCGFIYGVLIAFFYNLFRK